MTPEELLQAVQHDEMSFDEALDRHILHNLGVPLDNNPFCYCVMLAVGQASFGQWDKPINLPDGPSTVAEVIERFDLAAFVQEELDDGPDWRGENNDE